MNTPQHLCIHQLLEAQAERTPNGLAILAHGRAPLTYGRLRTHIHDVVQKLNAMGFSRNDRIALILPNGPEMAVAFLAVASTATCAPLNPTYNANELDSSLAGLHAKALIMQAGMDSPMRAIADARGIRIIELAPALDAEVGLFTITGEAQVSAAYNGLAQPEDVALLLHTAGTTSRPKVVPLTHANISTASHNLRVAFQLVESDRCLNVLPLFHTHALLTTLLTSLVAGASLVCTSGFDVSKFFAWMEEFRPTWYTAVPTIHHAILTCASLHREIIARCPLRFIRSASASLPPQMLAELERVFNTHVIETYGMTEASGSVTCNPPPLGKRKINSVGIAVGPEIAVADEVGTVLPVGETGEIIVRGASVFQGYDNNPAANASGFRNGWFRTGDQGYLDHDGYLFVTGRLKEIINRGGENISPREVEEVLMEHPAVAQVVAFAMPHAQLGEEVAAAIVLLKDTSATGREIRAFAAARLADFKVPRQFVFVNEIPKGPTGKVQRIGLAAKLGVMLPNQGQIEDKAGYTAPRTPLEAELARIWAQVLGIERVGIHNDFFDLGGHSLQAVSLFVQIEKVFGKNLPLPTLFQAPTIEQLASVLCQEGWSPSWSPLVAIQPSGSKPPFFCVHAHGGHVLVFKELAHLLGSDQPFYGLQAQGLDGKQLRQSRIEDMAANYIQEMRTVQLKGPYFLGGYCFGGQVAFEIAQQLYTQGEKVALLALLDAYAPGYPKLLPWILRCKERATYHWGNLLRLGPHDRLNYILEKVRIIETRLGTRIKTTSQSSRGFEDPIPRSLREVQEANLQASSYYVPKVYPAKLIVFRPSKQPVEYLHDLQMGWGALAAGGIEVHEVPGIHQSIIVEPRVRVLAEQLRACLQKAQTTDLIKGGSHASGES